MGDVLDLNPPNGNRRCPACGGEWWRTAGVVIDDVTCSVVGHAEPLEYIQCAGGGDLVALPGGDA